ncbi:nucleotide exchange factor GrpE [Sandaracinobacter neustonicus]|uniref:Protein GrpE n=1 Tax=Sandaracinobacter neustonicus TaxID=1715348 RepID=A0A501XI26_9SPHN|nr:nucleotide exchange factor GrpE [Sandaracinobacter neustonicus]TPE60135.1 nucleotide exchange factor GrpE [Sandaracinobacter neustonicus]
MTAETPDIGADEHTVEQELAAAREEIVSLVTERDAERDRALRMAAEAENTRRRLERDKADAVQYAAANFARDMLTVADNLTRALESLPAEASDALRAGLEATGRELSAILERHGVKRVPAVGLPLDPNSHQAMVEVEHDAEPGTIVSELQAGYMLKDRLLRPALVTVAKAKG